MTKTILLAAAVCVAAASCTQERQKTPRELLSERMEASVSSGKVMYGHQDDLMYGHTWRLSSDDTEFSRSDVYEVCGRYPAVLGLDLGEIELGGPKNLDGVDFGQMKEAAVKHYLRGGIVTFSWHPRNPLTGGDAWDISSGEVVRSILPGGEKHDAFIEGWLKPVASFFASLTAPDGTPVPVVFRPWHEHTGSWFWWGESLCTPEEYNGLWEMTCGYMAEMGLKERIVWAWSPSTQGDITKEHFLERYPGDEFVDILGVDAYYTQTDFDRDTRKCLDCLEEICNERGKLMALTETGWEGIPSDGWWCGILLPLLKEYPLCYVLTWRNAWDRPEHFFGPWKNARCEEDFIKFASDGRTEFLPR